MSTPAQASDTLNRCLALSETPRGLRRDWEDEKLTEEDQAMGRRMGFDAKLWGLKGRVTGGWVTGGLPGGGDSRAGRDERGGPGPGLARVRVQGGGQAGGLCREQK